MSTELPDDFPHHCSICGIECPSPWAHNTYPNVVCDRCDDRAVIEPGTEPEFRDNPVFIDGVRCWRRYKGSNWVTMREAHPCTDYDGFYRSHRDTYGPIHSFNTANPSPEFFRDGPAQQREGRSSPVVRVVEGDLLDQSADAYVCGITTDPSLEGGVAGAICDATEHPIRELVKAKSPVSLGEVVIIGGYDLPASYLLFVAATPAEKGENATKQWIGKALNSAIKQASKLRIETIATPLIGSGAGGASVSTAAQAIIIPPNSSQRVYPKCVRVVARNGADYRDTANILANNSLDELENEADPLEGAIQVQFDRVDKSGEVGDWKIKPWVRFDPFTGDAEGIVSDQSSTQIAFSDFTPPEKAVQLIRSEADSIVEDNYIPGQWLSKFDDFNSQLGGIRASIIHPEVGRPIRDPERGILGALRGLEAPGSDFESIIDLWTTSSGTNPRENTARIGYELPSGSIETEEDVESVGLETALRVVAYTIDTLSQFTFQKPQHGLMTVTRIDRIEIKGYAFSRVAYELEISIDRAMDVTYGDATIENLKHAAERYENHLGTNS